MARATPIDPCIACNMETLTTEKKERFTLGSRVPGKKITVGEAIRFLVPSTTFKPYEVNYICQKCQVMLGTVTYPANVHKILKENKVRNATTEIGDMTGQLKTSMPVGEDDRKKMKIVYIERHKGGKIPFIPTVLNDIKHGYHQRALNKLFANSKKARQVLNKVVQTSVRKEITAFLHNNSIDHFKVATGERDVMKSFDWKGFNLHMMKHMPLLYSAVLGAFTNRKQACQVIADITHVANRPKDKGSVTLPNDDKFPSVDKTIVTRTSKRLRNNNHSSASATLSSSTSNPYLKQRYRPMSNSATTSQQYASDSHEDESTSVKRSVGQNAESQIHQVERSSVSKSSKKLKSSSTSSSNIKPYQKQCHVPASTTTSTTDVKKHHSASDDVLNMIPNQLLPKIGFQLAVPLYTRNPIKFKLLHAEVTRLMFRGSNKRLFRMMNKLGVSQSLTVARKMSRDQAAAKDDGNTITEADLIQSSPVALSETDIACQNLSDTLPGNDQDTDMDNYTGDPSFTVHTDMSETCVELDDEAHHPQPIVAAFEQTDDETSIWSKDNEEQDLMGFNDMY